MSHYLQFSRPAQKFLIHHESNANAMIYLKHINRALYTSFVFSTLIKCTVKFDQYSNIFIQPIFFTYTAFGLDFLKYKLHRNK